MTENEQALREAKGAQVPEQADPSPVPSETKMVEGVRSAAPVLLTPLSPERSAELFGDLPSDGEG